MALRGEWGGVTSQFENGLRTPLLGCPAPGHLRRAVMQQYASARTIRGVGNVTPGAVYFSATRKSWELPIAGRILGIGLRYAKRGFLL